MFLRTSPGNSGDHRRPWAGRKRWVGVLGVLLLAVSACGGNTADEGTPVKGGTLVYGLEADTANAWAPYKASYATSGYIPLSAVSDSLFAANDDGKIVPLLAESVDHNDDYTEWTIKV